MWAVSTSVQFPGDSAGKGAGAGAVRGLPTGPSWVDWEGLPTGPLRMTWGPGLLVLQRETGMKG